MNNPSVTANQLTAMTKKLAVAISSRAALEKDFSSQSSLLIKFIGKLSLACKGIDVELDNRLAKLRVVLTKSAPITEIAQSIDVISQLLKQHSTKNTQNISAIHQHFHDSGKNLQKTNGLPKLLRRDLRELLLENEDTKESLVQYIDVFSQLLSFYEQVFKVKDRGNINSVTTGLLGDSTTPGINSVNSEKSSPRPNNFNNVNNLDPQYIKQLSSILTSLKLSEVSNRQIENIKNKLVKDMTSDVLLSTFVETLHVIINDFKQEQAIAKTFLSTLSQSLVSIKQAVQSTSTLTAGSKIEHDNLNNSLQIQIVDIAKTLDGANSLTEIKVDVNEKFQMMTKTLEEKFTLEKKGQCSIEEQLVNMTQRVTLLEQQSQSFEKRIKEQQEKSMQDALTKLGNRASFDNFFAKQMVRYHHKTFQLTITVLDLDDFKRINDTFGHIAGDKTLQVVAKTIEKMAGNNVFTARYGGEEFVLVHSGVTKETVMKSLNAIKKQIASLPFKFKGSSVTITASIGTTHVTADDNIHTAFERADNALYKAKEQGKNQVVYL